MTTWVLIIWIVGGYQRNVSIASIEGFTTAQACHKAEYQAKNYSNDIGAVCVEKS